MFLLAWGKKGCVENNVLWDQRDPLLQLGPDQFDLLLSTVDPPHPALSGWCPSHFQEKGHKHSWMYESPQHPLRKHQGGGEFLSGSGNVWEFLGLGLGSPGRGEAPILSVGAKETWGRVFRLVCTPSGYEVVLICYFSDV